MTQAGADGRRERPALRLGLAGIGICFLSAALFCAHNVFAKHAYGAGIEPLTVVVARSWLIVLATAAILALRRGRFLIRRDRWPLFALVAALYCFHNWAIMEALRHLPAGLTVLIVYLYPIVVLMLAAALGWSRLTAFGLGAALAAFLGIALVIGFVPAAFDPFGLVLAFLSAAALGANFIGAERLSEGNSTAAILFNLAAIGAVVLTGASLATGTLVRPADWPAGFYLAAAAALMPAALLLQYAGIAALGAPRASMAMNIEPVLMFGFGAVFLGERLGGWQIPGALLVAGAIAAIAWRDGRQRA